MQLSHSKAEARALQGARQQPCALPRARLPHAVPCNNLSAPSAAPRGAVNAACADSVRARVIARVAAAERPTMEAIIGTGLGHLQHCSMHVKKNDALLARQQGMPAGCMVAWCAASIRGAGNRRRLAAGSTHRLLHIRSHGTSSV